MAKLNRCCCDWRRIDWRRIGLILTIFLIVIYTMALFQLWIESNPIVGECALFDTGQWLVGAAPLTFMTHSFFHSIADIWVVVSVVLFFIWNWLDFAERELVFGRYMLVWASVYAQRIITIGATRLPIISGDEPFVTSSPIWGAILVTVGVKKTLSDFMFSGHTATWVITALFVLTYAHHRFLAWLYVAFNIVGPFLLLVVREHYTADI